ncbi:MAG: DUF4926 domain-containing protein [Thermomicrobiales bacterium]
MIDEFDVVALRVPLPNAHMYDGSDGLHVDDQGAVVDAAPDGQYFIVEFFRNGETVAIETVTPDQVRLVQQVRPASKHKTVNA